MFWLCEQILDGISSYSLSAAPPINNKLSCGVTLAGFPSKCIAHFVYLFEQCLSISYPSNIYIFFFFLNFCICTQQFYMWKHWDRARKQVDGKVPSGEQCMSVCLTMRCWADTRLSQSLSGGTLLSGCISSGWAFPWSRLCRGSCGVPWASALSSFSQDKCSWLMASSPSTTEAKGDVACLEDMTLLRSENRSENRVKTEKPHKSFSTVHKVMFPRVFYGWQQPQTSGCHGLNSDYELCIWAVSPEWAECSTWLSHVAAVACGVCSGPWGP